MITSGMFNNRVDKDVMVATLRMTDINVDSAPLNAGNYLDDFLTNLASLLSADTLYVATVCPTTLEPSILSSIQQGQPVNGLDINFHSMPCFIAYQRGYAEYDRNLASRFPAQVQLQRWQSQAYIGIRLNDLTDKPLGILSVFFNRELAPHKLELNLIRLLADFLARELSANPPALMPAANMPPLDPAAPQSVYRHWFEDNIKQGRSEHSVRSVFNITTESKKIEQQNITQANFDALTGLPNRQYFSAEMHNIIDQSAVNGQKFALLYIDIDDFKSVNNSEDFLAGDKLLKEVTERLKYRCREHDFLARIDGDEFAFIIPEVVNKRQAEVYGKQLQGGFTQAFQLSNQQRYITASVGITMYPEDGDTVEALMQSAEQAVFEAKRNGRNQCVTFTQELSDAAILKHQTVIDLGEAIKRGNLDVYYQPIVDNISGEVNKVEALVRWLHQDRGFISPAEFIPLAEEAGLIQSLGEYVLDKACGDLKILHDAGYHEIEMSINRSSLEFKTVDMQASEWLQVIASHHLPYAAITMEITESLLMDTDDQYMPRINALKDAGVKIAIDDFGTGYSSLNYLRSLRADIVKIDRSFINDIPQNQQDNLLLDGIINIVHNLGMKVVTEGVETSAQQDYLQSRCCDYSQGFLLSRPISLHELFAFIARNKHADK